VTDSTTQTVAPTKPASIREFTPRSITVGLIVALLMGASYPYVVLKFGFGPNISVVSAFFGFVALGLLSKSYNRWENNIVQTAGTTAGQVAFLCWLLAAFDMMAAEPGSGFDVHLTRLQTFVWLSAAGLLGVFLAVPLRKHFIEDEQLPFPDGMAAGETLIMLDSRGPQARKSAFAMMGSLVASGVTFLATQLQWIADSIPLVVNAFSARVGLRHFAAQYRVGNHHRLPRQRQHADRCGDCLGCDAAMAPATGTHRSRCAPRGHSVDRYVARRGHARRRWARWSAAPLERTSQDIQGTDGRQRCVW
jgi:uncharacterized oligopeptide transporter (OPT) family protein